MSDWDAARYHRVSDPQRAWGLRVLERLRPRDGERILDIGCGTGRLTGDIVARAPDARVVAMDRSSAMLKEARLHLAARVPLVHADAAALPFEACFDAVFSTATFHWVLDHERLFRGILQALRPGGRLVSQAGGGPNLATLRRRARALLESREFGELAGGWQEPWRYAGVDDTRRRLEEAGFVDIDVSLEPAPTTFDDAPAYSEFVACVCLRRQLDLVPAERHDAFMRRITEAAAADDPPLTLDYWRLNVDARKPR
ncbi:MAG TPA: methyltransferase domain-containing protein [Vicinamibacterales bacterium]|nr:methyltransferase domain-containing protein [Vicinamibacterales bacterium]